MPATGHAEVDRVDGAWIVQPVLAFVPFARAAFGDFYRGVAWWGPIAPLPARTAQAPPLNGDVVFNPLQKAGERRDLLHINDGLICGKANQD